MTGIAHRDSLLFSTQRNNLALQHRTGAVRGRAGTPTHKDTINAVIHMKFFHRAFLLTALSLAPLVSGAMTTTCGPDICYQYDETQAAVAWFGTPFRVGNEMQFLPANFYALSEDGAGLDSHSATFVFDRVYTVSGVEILGVSVEESGDYEIIGNGSVSALLGLTVDSNVLGTDTTSTSSMFSASTDSGGPDLWGTTASVWPQAAFVGLANDLKVAIANTLTANTTAPGQYALIQKKFTMEAQWLPGTTVVPVPAAAWLLGSGIAVLGALRRRSRRADPALC